MSPPSGPTVLVVGGGLTGAAVCRALVRNNLPAASISVWEALDGIGGRFHTEVRAKSGARCDTGAQYMTVTDDAALATAHASLYDELLSAGVIQPLAGRIEGGRAADGGGSNYVAPAGLSSVVSHLFASCGVRPTCTRRAVSLRRTVGTARGASAAGWEVRSADGAVDRFDGVVLTQPIAPMIELLDTGEGGAWLDAATTPDRGATAAAGAGASLRRFDLESIQYSSRYALSLFFSPSDAAAFRENVDWVSRYVNKDEDDALVYLGIDSAKRSKSGGMKDPTASEAAIEADLTSRVRKLLPWLPPAEESVLRPWVISQVRYPVNVPNGAACWHLAQPPGGGGGGGGAGAAAEGPLLLAGDAFSRLGSRFDGCIHSGDEAAAKLLEKMAH